MASARYMVPEAIAFTNAYVGRLDLYISVGKSDGLGALRFGGDQADIPNILAGRVRQFTGARKGHVGDADAQFVGDRLRHVRRVHDLLRAADRDLAGAPARRAQPPSR